MGTLGNCEGSGDIDRRAREIRRFNRFYTKQIGVLHEGLLGSRFSLTEARVLFELAHHDENTATALVEQLGIDPGYLSRVLAKFERSGMIQREQCEEDARRRILRLTDAGRGEFALLDSRSQQEVEAMLEGISPENQRRLIRAMGAIEGVLGKHQEEPSPFLLRQHQPGDIGWVTHRHGVLYAEEYGWDETFEALVAEILVAFIRTYDPRRERSWIAEMDGDIVGSVFVARESDEVAKLRLLLVEPRARGRGLGTRLVDECIRFARRAGYGKLRLWTNSVLHAARQIYTKAGFRLMVEEPHHSYGHDLVGETWELPLR